MPSITAVTGDLADQNIDVIVNAADRGVRGGSGVVDAALHRRGGPTILDDCIARFPGGLQTGDAGVTTAGDLRARWIVHAVGPDHTAAADGRAFLASCYRRALPLADGLDAASVAFPLIGSGARGWPHEVAAAVAVETIADTATHVDDVHIVTTDGSSAYSVEAALMQAVPRRILQGIGELHRRGFHQVRVLPGMSPSGGHWRLLVTAGGRPRHPGRPSGSGRDLHRLLVGRPERLRRWTRRCDHPPAPGRGSRSFCTPFAHGSVGRSGLCCLVRRSPRDRGGDRAGARRVRRLFRRRHRLGDRLGWQQPISRSATALGAQLAGDIRMDDNGRRLSVL
ncbi:O-acetyl-ADP-ribose deacetylase (regulator of RNase III) [Pseudonocardia sediminis]|uniref:O-acetyl-ADP-ribose deacetylase (Regulator of RNase III) n=1 Tax=Pseudonocardia sediminis TaxID=1397368 RepID=A0A4Q7V3K1_PSEST|nr:O-acetyl-ADP-ribose deacetylase (regulator of RNase III) [Pseudonocardia sediminis]